MKRQTFALLFVYPLILALTVSALAAEFRVEANSPELSFDGNTATCTIFCRSTYVTDKVEATLTLYQGKEYVDSWSDSGTGYVLISESCKVESGKSYRLVLEYSINGVLKKPVSTSATCP